MAGSCLLLAEMISVSVATAVLWESWPKRTTIPLAQRKGSRRCCYPTQAFNASKHLNSVAKVRSISRSSEEHLRTAMYLPNFWMKLQFRKTTETGTKPLIY